MSQKSSSNLHLALANARGGSEQGWTAVSLALKVRLNQLSFCRGVSRHDLDDVLQRTLLRLYQQIGDFRECGNGDAWVLSIAYFEILTLRRARERNREIFSVDVQHVVEERLPDPEASYMGRELLKMTICAAQTLSKKDKEALVVSVSSGPCGAALRKRRQRARGRLRKACAGIYQIKGEVSQA